MTDAEVRQTLDSARQNLREGRFSEAGQSYRTLLQSSPDHPDALYGLAMATFSLGHAVDALPIMERAIALRSGRADYHYNLGVILNALGRLPEAIGSFQQALALKPDFTEALYNLAVALRSDGKLAESIAASRQLLNIHPKNAAACINLGTALAAAGNMSEALAAFDRACEIAPNLPEAQYNRANVLRALDRAGDAVKAYEETVRLRPDWSDAWNNLGTTYRSLQQLQPAMQAYQKTLSLVPNHLGAICGIASIQCLRGNFDEGIKGYRRALEIDPKFATALTGFASALSGLGQNAEAADALRQAIAIDPTEPAARWSLARTLLAMGQWTEGWEESEWRLNVFTAGLNRGFRQPQWDGQDIAGKTLLLHVEGGHGDGIQFIRYVPLAAQRGAKVILECLPALFELFRQIPGVDQLVQRGRPLPDFDYHCPLLSLPRIFKTTVETIPGPSPYLVAPPDRVRKFAAKIRAYSPSPCAQGEGRGEGPSAGIAPHPNPLPEYRERGQMHEREQIRERGQMREGGQISAGDLKVGLVWAGRPLFADLRTRSIDVFAPLAKIPNVRFFSLQRGPEAAQKPPPGMDLIDLTADMDDFADAAGLLENLDLTIAVDTAIVHLAGAMAKPVWTLNPFKTDFRWLLDRDDTPWYPSMRLYRQARDGDWQRPISRIVEDLRKLAASR